MGNVNDPLSPADLISSKILSFPYFKSTSSVPTTKRRRTIENHRPALKKEKRMKKDNPEQISKEYLINIARTSSNSAKKSQMSDRETAGSNPGQNSIFDVIMGYPMHKYGNEPDHCNENQSPHVKEEVMIGLVQNAFLLLSKQDGVEMSPESNMQAAEIGRLIKQAMEGTNRFFHSSGHAVKLAGHNQDKFDVPVVTLAALFHDVVYVQIDGGINDACDMYIKKNNIVRIGRDPESGDWIGTITVDLNVLKSSTDYVSKALLATCIMFGVEENSELSHKNGLNEFLSALTAVYALSPAIKTLSVLVEIVTIIEATIPFRGKGFDTGLSVGEALRERLNKVRSVSIEIRHWNEERCNNAIDRAMFLANKDVGSFVQSVDEFLSDTFKLLPETNWELWESKAFTAKQYRTALRGMYQFFGFLENARIFQRYASFPSEQEFQKLEKTSRRNVLIGKAYLALKLISIGLLEALSDLSLVDNCADQERLGSRNSIPYSVLLGDVDNQNAWNFDFPLYGSETHTEEQASAKIPHHGPNNMNSNQENSVFRSNILIDLQKLLTKGLAWGTDFDLKKSALELNIFRSNSATDLENLLTKLLSLWSNKASSREILQEFPSELVRNVIEAQIFLQQSILDSPDHKFRNERIELVKSLKLYVKTA